MSVMTEMGNDIESCFVKRYIHCLVRHVHTCYEVYNEVYTVLTCPERRTRASMYEHIIALFSRIHDFSLDTAKRRATDVKLLIMSSGIN